MGVTGHVRGNRKETDNNEYANAWISKMSPVTLISQLMFTNTEAHEIVRISKTDQDNPNL